MKPHRRLIPVLCTVVAAAVAAACARTSAVQTDLQAPPGTQTFAATSASTPTSDARLRPPQGCKGGPAGGTAAIWALEFQDGRSPWQRKGWSGDWQKWTEGLDIAPADGPTLIGRVRTLNNWNLILEFERDGQVVARESVGYQRPCVYASQDRQDNVILFYRKQS